MGGLTSKKHIVVTVDEKAPTFDEVVRADTAWLSSLFSSLVSSDEAYLSELVADMIARGPVLDRDEAFLRRVFSAAASEGGGEPRLSRDDFGRLAFNACSLPAGDFLAKFIFNLYDPLRQGSVETRVYIAMLLDMVDPFLSLDEQDHEVHRFENNSVSWKEFRRGIIKLHGEGKKNIYAGAFEMRGRLRQLCAPPSSVDDDSIAYWEKQAKELHLQLEEANVWR